MEATNTGVVLAGGLLALWLVLLVVDKRRAWAERKRKEALAARIARMPVKYAEQKVDVSFCEEDATLQTVGRTDEVREDASGVLFVGDIKTRSDWRVSKADVAGLTLYSYLLRVQIPDGRVSNVGFIRFINPYNGREAIVPVDLLPDNWVEDLLARYVDVRLNLRDPNQATCQSNCQNCEFAGKCYRQLRGDDDEPLLIDDGWDQNAPGWSAGGFRI